MAHRPNPEFRMAGERVLVGTMQIYASQSEASQLIPQQWRAFRQGQPALGVNAEFYGASPCTDDRKIHYLAGVLHKDPGSIAGLERLTLEAGEYAVVLVSDIASLRDTWIWLLTDWLASSGRRERDAPEFERFTGVSDDGTPIGPVEIGIPLEPVATD